MKLDRAIKPVHLVFAAAGLLVLAVTLIISSANVQTIEPVKKTVLQATKKENYNSYYVNVNSYLSGGKKHGVDALAKQSFISMEEEKLHKYVDKNKKEQTRREKEEAKKAAKEAKEAEEARQAEQNNESSD